MKKGGEEAKGNWEDWGYKRIILNLNFKVRIHRQEGKHSEEVGRGVVF